MRRFRPNWYDKRDDMERLLENLFDYYRFNENPRLARMIEETDSFYGKKLSDDDLELVNAAGDIDSAKQMPAPEDGFDE